MGYNVGGHLKSDDPLNVMTTGELEMVRNEEFHTEGGMIMARTTTRMITEVVMDGSGDNNPGQIVEMGGEVKS